MLGFDYILTLIITFCGLFVGIFLVYIAPEELKFRKYFKIMKYIIFAFIAILFMFSELKKLSGILFFISLCVLLYYYFMPESKIQDIVAYIFFAIVFYLTFKDECIHIQSSLMILFGFAMGSLVRDKFSNKALNVSVIYVLKNYSIFIILGLILRVIGF